MERYVIHACPDRMWYVEGFLLPSLLEQGICRDDILIWNDEEHKGNLWAAMECFEYCGKHDGGCWHLQDDVIVASDFAIRTKDADKYIMCGFCHVGFEKHDGRSVDQIGMVESRYMWSSFPCIYIPNWIAKDFASWFYRKAMYRQEYVMFLHEKKHDDGFWRDYINECHQYDKVINVAPSLIDHVDWLIGGSIVNTMRGTNCRSYHWEEEELISKLKQNLRQKGFGNRILF